MVDRKVAEVDERPGHAGGAAEDGEDEEPGDEEDEDVGGPDPRVHEPGRCSCSDPAGAPPAHAAPPSIPSPYLRARAAGRWLLPSGSASREPRVGRHRGAKGRRKVTMCAPLDLDPEAAARFDLGPPSLPRVRYGDRARREGRRRRGRQ